jgi:hypothetical protein
MVGVDGVLGDRRKAAISDFTNQHPVPWFCPRDGRAPRSQRRRKVLKVDEPDEDDGVG